MRGLIFTLLFLITSNVDGQEYFNKYLEPVGLLNPNITDLTIIGDEIIIPSLHIDNFSILHKINLDGELVSECQFNEFTIAGEGLLTIDNDIYLWGKNRDQDKALLLLRLNNNCQVTDQVEVSTNGVWNFPGNGSNSNSNIFVASIHRENEVDDLKGGVHMYESDLSEKWYLQLNPDDTFVIVFFAKLLKTGDLLVSSRYKRGAVTGALTLIDQDGNLVIQNPLAEEISTGSSNEIVELSNGDIICGTVVDRLFDWEFQQNEWFEQPTKYYWLSGDNLQEQKDTIYINSKFERPGGEKLWKGNGDYFFIYGHIWFFDEDQTYGMLKKVDNDGNILWSRRYQHEDFTGDNNFHGIEHIQEMPDGSIYTAGSASFTGGRNHIWIMHLDENGCLGDDCGEVVITDVENVAESISEITVFPNPAIELLTVDNLDYNKSYTYEIVDSSGSKAKKGEITLSEQFHINIKTLIPGIYTLQLKEKPTGKYTSLRFVVL